MLSVMVRYFNKIKKCIILHRDIQHKHTTYIILYRLFYSIRQGHTNRDIYGGTYKQGHTFWRFFK